MFSLNTSVCWNPIKLKFANPAPPILAPKHTTRQLYRAWQVSQTLGSQSQPTLGRQLYLGGVYRIMICSDSDEIQAVKTRTYFIRC